MKTREREKSISLALYGARLFAHYALLVGFVVTCCMMLFITSLQWSMGLVFTEENLQLAAKITFVNVMVLASVFTLVDYLRRRAYVERPAQVIIQAAQRLMEGDFSVRIPPLHTSGPSTALNDVALCFNHLAQELSGTEALRTDFMANVSHELKTPLAVMQNYAVMLQSPGLPDASRLEYARAIADASRRLSALVSNILKLNKLENQQIFPKKQRFLLGEQLCECLLAFESEWERKGLDIQTDIDDSVWVESDPELLMLVWNNLFSNAMKFTPEGGKVTLRLHAEGPFALVTVEDTGCGFGREVGEHIFEKFYQGDPSRATGGNGLGLALVKRVVDIVHGEISVQSQAGQGAAFTVRIRRDSHAEA